MRLSTLDPGTGKRRRQARADIARIGYTAVDLLLREAVGGPDFQHEQIVFQPELVVREPTA